MQPITKKGYEALKAELDRLRKVERPKVIEAIAEARSHGDLSENAEYEAAKERQGFIESRITELERKTRVTFVGEASGGSPNLYGDAQSIELPATGWHVNIASIWWVKSRRDDPRVTIDPSVPVRVSSTDFFAGRDPALGTAIAYRAR